MNYKEMRKKIPWIYDMPEIFDKEKEVLFIKRLDSISKKSQEHLIYSVMTTIMNAFNCSNAFTEDCKNEQEKAIHFANQAAMWISGLCGVSLAQIVVALIDIIDLKTEYQKWPPKSVIEFHAVCKAPRPAYLDYQDKSELLALSYDKSIRRKKSEEAAAENLQKMRVIVKRAMSKNKMDLDFPIKTEEELKEIYRSNREAPLIFCNKHGLYDYKDRGCCKCRTG